jgi:hypothetical protein
MKRLALILFMFASLSGNTQQAPPQTVLTFEQIVGWLNSYGSVLDKDLPAATSKFGDPDASTRYSRTWNPSSRTGFRTITVGIAEAAEGDPALIRRITILPGQTDVFSIDQLLHQPEMFLFASGRTARQESYLDIETKNRQFKFRFLCAPDREPRLQSVELKSIASPDDVL